MTRPKLRKKLSAEDAVQGADLHDAGVQLPEIAQRLGRSLASVRTGVLREVGRRRGYVHVRGMNNTLPDDVRNGIKRSLRDQAERDDIIIQFGVSDAAIDIIAVEYRRERAAAGLPPLRPVRIVGSLVAEQVATLTNLVREGADNATCAAAIGLGAQATRGHRQRIASALNVMLLEDQQEATDQARRLEVADLIDKGLTDAAIAEQLALPVKQVKQIIISGDLKRFIAVRLPDHLRDQLKHRLLNGERARTIARDLGCNRSTVVQYRDQLRRDIDLSAYPDCPCSLPLLHEGLCVRQKAGAAAPSASEERRPVLEFEDRKMRDAYIVKRVQQGVPAVRIAERLGADPRTIQKQIKAMRSAGNKVPTNCRCGKPYGHYQRCLGQQKVDLKRSFALQRSMQHHGSLARVAAAFGMAERTVARILKARRDKVSLGPQICGCGRPKPHPGQCAANHPTRLQRFEEERVKEAMLQGESLKRISNRLGITLERIKKVAVAARSEWAEAGVLCGCGRPAGHVGACAIKHASWEAAQPVKARLPLAPETRSAIRRELMDGIAKKKVATKHGASSAQIAEIFASLTEKEVGEARAIRARKVFWSRPGRADELIGIVRAIIPNTVPTAMRDEIMVDATAAIANGYVSVNDAGTAVRWAIRAAYDQTRRAGRSLDAPIGDGGSRSLADMIGDSTASLHVDEIQIGKPPP